MLNVTIGIVTVLLSFIMVFAAPSLLTQSTVRYFNKKVRINGKLGFAPLSLKQKIISCTPIVQMVYLRKVFYNGKAGFTLILAILPAVLVLLRLVVFALIPITVLWIATAIGILIALVLVYLLYSIVIWDIGRMAQCSTLVLIVALVMPFVGAIFVRQRLPEMFGSYFEEKRMEGKE